MRAFGMRDDEGRSGLSEERRGAVMATTSGHEHIEHTEHIDGATRGGPATEAVWHALAKRSFAILACVTPTGDPRSSGVVYEAVGRRLYVAVAPDSWKARHVAANGRVAVTVPVRRGGLLSLVFPVPPATISFHARATVHPAGAPEVAPVLREMASLLPAERRGTASIIELVPEGAFLTYGIGVPLRQMRDPAASLAHVSVS
jgi:hypothetical protein